MQCPIVSVILPCYNAEKHLRQCLDSILHQTLTNIEILCIDDGSTDSTPEILAEYAGKDPRVRVLRQENAGAGSARNAGLTLARGTYLSFLDSDDFFEPDMLEKAVSSAEDYQSDFVVFASDRYLQDKNTFSETPWTIRRQDLPPYMPFTYRQLTDNVFLTFVGWAWDKVYRRSFVQQHGLTFQEQRTTNDMLFVFSALICAKRITVVDQVLVHQRRGSSATLSVTREKSWHCFYDALMALRKFLKEQNRFWELEQDYVNYCLHFSLWNVNTLAEPTRSTLQKKLREEWFTEMGITGKPASYFYDQYEYAQYQKMRKVSKWI